MLLAFFVMFRLEKGGVEVKLPQAPLIQQFIAFSVFLCKKNYCWNECGWQEQESIWSTLDTTLTQHHADISASKICWLINDWVLESSWQFKIVFIGSSSADWHQVVVGKQYTSNTIWTWVVLTVWHSNFVALLSTKPNQTSNSIVITWMKDKK